MMELTACPPSAGWLSTRILPAPSAVVSAGVELVRSGVAALERGPAALTAPEDDSTP